ncbi:unnamed protein product [Prunus armeniaca]|uniref:Uncharacterized protein n=1 Tax=Prunus armeniaca TaxID=36596 RepID=A0A6J5UHH5_PRUAR|nr:unnamed protein product [Prunus armeniaca]CAB4305720.1 unnamed protein product [Prunus armeniaca]
MGAAEFVNLSGDKIGDLQFSIDYFGVVSLQKSKSLIELKGVCVGEGYLMRAHHNWCGIN